MTTYLCGCCQSNSLSGQGKEKGSSLTFFADAPDGAPMPLDDLLHCGQADAGSWVLAGVVQSLEGGEEILSVLHVETDAVILDIEDRFSLLLDHAEFDLRFRLAPGVFPGVFQEISQRHPQQLLVTRANQRFRDNSDHLALRFSHRQLLDNIPCHGGEIEALTVKILANDVGQDQDRLDQSLHPLTPLADVVEE